MATVEIKTCPYFDETYVSKLRSKGDISGRLNDFINMKSSNPLQPFNKTDRPFLGGGHLKSAVPGETLQHAHLTHDGVLVYSISGRDPKILKLYAILTHDELGIGQPANKRKQMQAGANFANQANKFSPYEIPGPTRR